MEIEQAPTVVVVDDERSIVEVICDVLDFEGIPAKGCSHADKAFPFIRQIHPRLVILDVQMPGVDGVEVFRHLRGDPETMGIPVIFFTANSQTLHQRLPDFRAMNAELLPKPFNLHKLLTLVRRVLAS